MTVTPQGTQELIEVQHCYLHLGNGGVSFSVKDDPKFGPCIEVLSRHFGQQTSHLQLMTTPETLESLGKMFLEASQYSFRGKKYVYAAEELPAHEESTEGSDRAINCGG